MWKKLTTESQTGSENGTIITDEQYDNTCRITIDLCKAYHAITCGIYGEMVHTIFCSEEKSQDIYDAVKKMLQTFIDSNPSNEEKTRFYEQLTARY